MDETLNIIEILSELERGLADRRIAEIKEDEKRHARIISSIISRFQTIGDEIYLPAKGEAVLYVFSISAYQGRSREVIEKASERFSVLVVTFSRPCRDYGVECIEHSVEKRRENQFSSVKEVMITLERYGNWDLIVLDSLPALSVISSGYEELKKFVYYLIKKVKDSEKSIMIFTVKGTISGEIEAFVASLCDRVVSLE